MNDIYTWFVMYTDETTCGEYDPDRLDGRGFAEIGEKPVKSISIVSTTASHHYESHHVHIPDGAQPIFFRRRFIGLDGSGEQTTVHCIGWKREESANYLFIFPDGSSLLSEDVQAV